MRRVLGSALFAAVVALGPVIQPDVAQAGGWTQPEGAYYVKIWDRSLISPSDGSAFDQNGDVKAGLSGFQDHQLNVYAEYGLIDSLTLVGFSTPFGLARFSGEQAVYVGTTGLGGRYRLLDGAIKLAVQAQYSYAPPIGDDPVATEVTPAPDSLTVVYVPTVSTHAGEAQLQAGYGLSWGWLTGSAGFRANSESKVGHAVTGFAQLGITKLPNWTFDLHANLYQSLDDIQVVNLAGAGRTSYFGLGLGAGYALTKSVSIVASVEGVAYAKSNAATPSFVLGAELRP